eukprot:s5515_g3.t1
MQPAPRRLRKPLAALSLLLIVFAVDVGQLLGFTGSRGSVGSRQPSVGRAAEYKQVAVAGATGRLGRFVVSELLAKDDELQVIALTRNVSRAEEFLPVENDRLKVVTWDPAADQAAAEEVVADADVALWCAEGRKGIVALGNAFKAKGQRPSGSARVIMCSSAAITRPTWSAKQKSQMSGAADIPIVRLNPGGLLDEKRAAEQALRDTGASYAVARPTGLKDDWPAGRPVVSQGDAGAAACAYLSMPVWVTDPPRCGIDEPEATGKTFEVLTVPGYPKPREGYGQALERLEPDTAADLFDCFDKDTSGALSVQGLSHIADSDSRELHELLVAADINTDGVITRTEWDQHVSSWFEGHEGQVQAILDAASGITEEVLQTKRKKVRSKRQIAAVWDGARSDGEDEIGWFGLPAVASQDLSFKAENRAVPIGQKLEVMVGGSCFLCEVAAYDEELVGEDGAGRVREGEEDREGEDDGGLAETEGGEGGAGGGQRREEGGAGRGGGEGRGQEDETTDPHHELHQAAKTQVLEFLDRLQDGNVMVGDRELTYCINRSLQQMRQAIHRYPRHQPVGPAGEGATDVPMRSAEDGVPMETETGSTASSTTRRPKAKARPRQPTVIANVIIIRYDNPRNLGTDVATRRGKYLACGVDIEQVGLVSQDAVGKLIENVSDARDRQLPQRGDQPRFAVDVETGRYVNKGYTCTADNVKGGILELMPLDGAQFVQGLEHCQILSHSRSDAPRSEEGILGAVLHSDGLTSPHWQSGWNNYSRWKR